MKLQEIIRQLSAQRTICIKELRKKLWEYAEPGYKEHHSVALLTNVLKKSGFTVETGIADISTAFCARWGSGKPVIG